MALPGPIRVAAPSTSYPPLPATWPCFSAHAHRPLPPRKNALRAVAEPGWLRTTRYGPVLTVSPAPHAAPANPAAPSMARLRTAHYETRTAARPGQAPCPGAFFCWVSSPVCARETKPSLPVAVFWSQTEFSDGSFETCGSLSEGSLLAGLLEDGFRRLALIRLEHPDHILRHSDKNPLASFLNDIKAAG